MAEALQTAYLAAYSAETNAILDAMEVDTDSDSANSSSHSTSSSSSEDMELPALSQVFLAELTGLYSQRYINERTPITKTPVNMALLLTDYKTTRPEIFRSYVRIWPECFDTLLAAIKDDPVFHNNSQNEQHPVEEQLAIALYRFGHFGNGATTLKVALWAGVGYGTVERITKRVIMAVCREEFRRAALHWPDDDEKEIAKTWVEENSCPAWRDGWVMVDGTLIPLFSRPGFYGNSWWDRKSNYSMNAQVSIYSNLEHSVCAETRLTLVV